MTAAFGRIHIELSPGTRAATDQSLARVSALVDAIVTAPPTQATERLDEIFDLITGVEVAAAMLNEQTGNDDTNSAVRVIAAEMARRLRAAHHG